jgi:redox-sensing transcriptional repressor
MLKKNNVSISVIRRLPRYYRFLGELMRLGISRISSGELSQRMGLTASQIRQDLNCFGGFGLQGYGYNVVALRSEIGAILGIDVKYPAILIGAGNIGRALANNLDFKSLGYNLTAIFDNDPKVIGTTVGSLTVLSIAEIDEFFKKNTVTAAIITTPRSAAPELADKLANLGISGILNFTHYDIAMKHPQIQVENIHINDSLMTLGYKIKASEENNRGK